MVKFVGFLFHVSLENSHRGSFVHHPHEHHSPRPKFFARAAMDEKTQELGGDSASSPRAVKFRIVES